MKRSLLSLWLALALLLAACQPAATASPSGVEGQVLIGPMCPVVQAGTPCPDQAYQATLIIQDQNGRQVLQIQTDAQGKFKANLATGTYTLVPVSPDGFTQAAEQAVTVTANTYTKVTVTYDSGIR
jgi:hypothetical protein